VPATHFDYERAGVGYATRRVADPRIARQVGAALGDARFVLNVGAGAGSYEPADRRVVAVEPSRTMREQRPAGAAPVVAAVAAALPFADGTFDAAMATLTIHHWPDVERGLRELRRVSRGPVVLLVGDGPAFLEFWLADYFPDLVAREAARHPDIGWVRSILGGTSTVQDVPIAADCTDGFIEAFYGRPELLLDPAVRRSQSAWGHVDAATVDAAMAALEADIACGAWDSRWGRLRHQPSYPGSLRLVIAHPDPETTD